MIGLVLFAVVMLGIPALAFYVSRPPKSRSSFEEDAEYKKNWG